MDLAAKIFVTVLVVASTGFLLWAVVIFERARREIRNSMGLQ